MNKSEKKACLAEIRDAYSLLAKGKLDGVRTILGRLQRKTLDEAELAAAVGDLCVRLGDHGMAINYLSMAMTQDPANVLLQAQLANAYIAFGDLARAEALLLAAAATDPECFEAVNSLALLANIRQDLSSACNWAEKAVSLKPADASARINLSFLLTNLDEHEKALEHAGVARRLAPKDVRCYLNLSRILVHLGRKEEARRQLEKALEIDPLCGPACEQLASMKKWTSQDLAFVTKIESRLQQRMVIQSRASFHFALGKIHDDIGEYEKAFEHFRKANVFGKPSVSREFDHDLIKQQKRLCTKRYLSSLPASGTSDIPVFVVGMPRSGTSLVEQIISSHPHADGAGELHEMLRLSRKLLDDNRYRDTLFGRRLPDRSMLDGLRDEYLAVLRKHRQSALRIVDKMPENFFFLGIIATLFPRARIINVMRHPLDTCLSCYFQMLEQLHWSFDFKTIAEAYHRYRQTLAYWEKTLPSGQLMHLQYESLIDNPEAEARRILAHIGLGWDPACLNFASNQRVVKTASLWQVRQPIYQTSRQRWMNYAPHIGDLADELAPFLQEEREVLRRHGSSLR